LGRSDHGWGGIASAQEANRGSTTIRVHPFRTQYRENRVQSVDPLIAEVIPNQIALAGVKNPGSLPAKNLAPGPSAGPSKRRSNDQTRVGSPVSSPGYGFVMVLEGCGPDIERRETRYKGRPWSAHRSSHVLATTPTLIKIAPPTRLTSTLGTTNRARVPMKEVRQRGRSPSAKPRRLTTMPMTMLAFRGRVENESRQSTRTLASWAANI